MKHAISVSSWTAYLNTIPVRIFPASWSLKEHKERARFQAASYDISDDITAKALFVKEQGSHKFLIDAGAKAFKIIKTNDGHRKIVLYLPTWDLLNHLLGLVQYWNGKEVRWCRHITPSLK